MALSGLTELQHVLIKIEGTEGTDAGPVAADALQLIGPATLAWGAEKKNERTALYTGTVDEATAIQPTGLYGEVTLKMWARGRGVAYSAPNKPEADVLHQAAGQAVSTSFVGGSEFYKYDNASTGTKTVTIYGFEMLETGAVILHKILASRVSRLSLSGEAWGPGVYDVTLRGCYNAPTDGGDVVPAYLTPVPPLWGGVASWTIGGTSPVATAFSASIENTLVPRFNANAAGFGGSKGLVGYVITRRRNLWTATIEESTVAAYDPHTDWTQAIVNVRQILATIAGGSGAQYNRVKVTIDKAVLEEPPALADDGGIRRYTLSGKGGPEGTNRVLFTYD